MRRPTLETCRLHMAVVWGATSFSPRIFACNAQRERSCEHATLCCDTLRVVTHGGMCCDTPWVVTQSACFGCVALQYGRRTVWRDSLPVCDALRVCNTSVFALLAPSAFAIAGCCRGVCVMLLFCCVVRVESAVPRGVADLSCTREKAPRPGCSGQAPS